MVTQNMLRTHEGKYVYSEKTDLDIIKCLAQIKEQRLLLLFFRYHLI